MEHSQIAEYDDDALEAALHPLKRIVDKDASTLAHLTNDFSTTFTKLATNSDVHFLPTPLDDLPDGNEDGEFLAIDAGGTHLRVAFVELDGTGSRRLGQLSSASVLNTDANPKVRILFEEVWPIEEHLKVYKADELFVWIGDCIATVIQKWVQYQVAHRDASWKQPEYIKLGVTFSFPMEQTMLEEATLLPMGKGFAITSNLSLGKILLAGYQRHTHPQLSTADPNDSSANGRYPSLRTTGKPLPELRIKAITNDTVATFASAAYKAEAAASTEVVMGLIVGTGTNAALEVPSDMMSVGKRSRYPLFGSPPDYLRISSTIANTEYSIRGTDPPLYTHEIQTAWDIELDALSDAPGFQPLEYMTSGRYLGELVRIILVDLFTRQTAPGTVEDGHESALPGVRAARLKSLPPALLKRNSITTTFLARHVLGQQSTGHHIDETSTVLDEHFPGSHSGHAQAFWTQSRTLLLRKIAQAVRERAAALIASVVIGLLLCSKKLKPSPEAEAESQPAHTLVIAYTGGTISGVPDFRRLCQRWIDDLSEKFGFRELIQLSEENDGGVIGAAVQAAMARD